MQVGLIILGFYLIMTLSPSKTGIFFFLIFFFAVCLLLEIPKSTLLFKAGIKCTKMIFTALLTCLLRYGGLALIELRIKVKECQY